MNPIDYYTVTGMRDVDPMPHIPGVEFAGIVEEVGKEVTRVSPGDRVVVYPRIFDGTCDLCMAEHEHLCRNGGIIGVNSNGGFAERAVVRESNVFRLPDSVPWDLAASLPVAGLTAFHALMEARVLPGDVVVIVGASGNTDQFTLQLAKLIGARVLAVTTKKWPAWLGAEEVATIEESYEVLTKMTGGKLADVVIDSLGTATLQTSLKLLDKRGRLIVYGALTGENITISVPDLYMREVQIIGATGGTRRDFLRLIDLAARGLLKVKIWRKLSLGEAREALKLVFSREGREDPADGLSLYILVALPRQERT